MKKSTRVTVTTLVSLGVCGTLLTLPAAATTQSDLEMPFPCGETWNGATRNNHPSSSDSYYALDLNRGSSPDADRGEQVVASEDGVVTNILRSYGRVTVDHGDGWGAVYTHMSNIRVQEGTRVKRGEVIGLVDSVSPTPVASHLHYEQRYNGTLRHIAFHGKQVEYSFDYSNPNYYTSQNCAPTPEPEPALAAYHYTTFNNGASGAPAFERGNNKQEHLVGDWDGNGTETPGQRVGNGFYLSDSPNGSRDHHTFTFGRADDDVVVGDWDGDGKDSIGIVRGRNWILRNSLSSGTSADYNFYYGESEGDEFVTGDWDGNGTDTPGVIRGTRWLLSNQNVSTSRADIDLIFGREDDEMFAGDWNGNGTDTPGVRRGNEWFLRGSTGPSVEATKVGYGRASDLPIVGDWDGDGDDTIGVIRFQ